MVSGWLIYMRHLNRLQKAKYGYLWVTLLFFVISIVGHWTFAWMAYVDEQMQEGLPIELKDYLVQVARDTLENWQSEFLQLIWQVAGLAYLLYVASPQSREGDERKEEKIDAILRAVSPKDGRAIIAELDRKYLKKE